MKTVLLVEDDPALRELFCEVLSDDYTVLAAASSREAAHLLTSEAVDAVVSDFHLRGETSQSILDVIRDQQPHLVSKTILITGDATLELDSSHTILHKPVDVSDLIHKIATLFDS